VQFVTKVESMGKDKKKFEFIWNNEEIIVIILTWVWKNMNQYVDEKKDQD